MYWVTKKKIKRQFRQKYFFSLYVNLFLKLLNSVCSAGFCECAAMRKANKSFPRDNLHLETSSLSFVIWQLGAAGRTATTKNLNLFLLPKVKHLIPLNDLLLRRSLITSHAFSYTRARTHFKFNITLVHILFNLSKELKA